MARLAQHHSECCNVVDALWSPKELQGLRRMTSWQNIPWEMSCVWKEYRNSQKVIHPRVKMQFPYSVQQWSQKLFPPFFISRWTTVVFGSYNHFPPCEGSEDIWISSSYLMSVAMIYSNTAIIITLNLKLAIFLTNFHIPWRFKKLWFHCIPYLFSHIYLLTWKITFG